MVRDYELMYIARPDLDEEGLQGAIDSIEQLINGTGGSVVRATSWGRRRLAYEVDHLRDGHYMLLHVRLEGARVVEVERALAIHETVFRHLLVVREGEEDNEPEGVADRGAADVTSGALAGVDGTEAGEARQAVVAGAQDDDEDDAHNQDDGDGAPAADPADDEEEN